MKRAPVIPKHTLNTQPVGDTSLSTPAAPMVDSLIARVGVMALSPRGWRSKFGMPGEAWF